MSCLLSDSENYHYTAALDVDVVPGSVANPPVIDWSGLTADIHGHRVGADFEIQRALLLVFLELDPQGVMAALSNDTLLQQDLSLYATCEPTSSKCAISDFVVMGRDLDLEQYYLDGYGTWLVLLQSDFEAGAHAMVFVPPAEGGASEVFVDDTTSSLEVAVDLTSGDDLHVAASADVTFDWSGLTVDGLGNPLAIHTLDRMMLARYDAPIETLEGQVFDLERIADERFDAQISGRTSVSLSEFVGPRVLTDLSAQGTWLMALYCSLCVNPAPKFVAQVYGDAP